MSTLIGNARVSRLFGLALTASAFLFGATATAANAPLVEADAQGTPDDGTPDIYFVPMKGQMGTDVHISVYRDVVKDIKKVDPDIVVFVMNCADYNTIFYLSDDNPTEQSLIRLGEYRELVRFLQAELADYRQVMWIEDSVGFSSVVALAWPEIYMTSSSRLAGLDRVLRMFSGFPDADVRGKMLAAWVGITNGFLEQGGYPLELGYAMILPERTLSVSFEGRGVRWQADTAGHWVIDSSDKATASFTGQLAEDVGLSKGIADEKEDLAFILGYREWRDVTSGEAIVDRYIEEWRRALEQSAQLGREYLDALRYAQGEDTVKYLGQAINRLERILAAMVKYPAVEIRYQEQQGITKEYIQIEIEKLREQIRALRDRRNSGNRGGGGGSGLGGGMRGPR